MLNSKLKIKKFRELPSTQLKAKELAGEGADPWTVILAEEQTLGQGRKGNIWYSPKGGLYFSIILPKSKIEDLQTLTILAAFIVAKIIREKFKLEPLIKLPNDVLLQGKKICGILTENVIGKALKLSVMGIGLNTNIKKFPEDLKEITTSVKIELGKEVDPVRDSEGKKKTQRKQISNGVDNQEILIQIIKGLKEQLKTISE